jgi:hypothetical protein
MSIWDGARLYAVKANLKRTETVTVYAVAHSASEARKIVSKASPDEIEGSFEETERRNVSAVSARVITRRSEIPSDDEEQLVFGSEAGGEAGTILQELLFDSLPDPIRETMRIVIGWIQDTRWSGPAEFAGLDIADTLDWQCLTLPDELPDGLLRCFVEETVNDGAEWNEARQVNEPTEEGLKEAHQEITKALATARRVLKAYAAKHPDGGAFEKVSSGGDRGAHREVEADVVKSMRASEEKHRKKMGQLREMRNEFLGRLRRVQQLLGPGG